MSSVPFDTGLIEARLKATVTLPRFLVAGAATYAAVQALQGFVSPSAYVLRAKESSPSAPPGAPHRAGRQVAVVQFAVAVVGRNYRDQTGAAAADDIDNLVGAIRAGLIGWTPAANGGRPVQWLQGDLLDYDHQRALWLDVFQTQHFIGQGQQ